MMEKFKVTKEMLDKAKTYMPFEDKIFYAKDIANRCLSPKRVSKENEVGETYAAFPEMYCEDGFLKAILMQNILLGYYFDIDVVIGEDPKSAYDFYASCNIIGNILRLKADAEIREKCYDILDDYHEFERLVNAEIKEQKALHNDPLARFAAMIALGSSPEAIQKAIDELQKLGEEQK